MFKDYPIFGMILAMIILFGFILAAIKMTKNLIAEDKVNFLLVLIVASFLAIWVIDNVVIFQIELLDKEENKFIMQALANIMFYVLGKNQIKKKKPKPTPKDNNDNQN